MTISKSMQKRINIQQGKPMDAPIEYSDKTWTQFVCPHCKKTAVRISTPYLERYYNGIELVCSCGTRTIYRPGTTDDQKS